MKNKDWRGGRASVFKTLGASNHTDHERAHGDYYATEPKATEWLLKLEKFNGPILEPSCGEGHISKVLIGGGILSFHAILSIEAMANKPISSVSTINSGMATSLQTLLMPTHRSLSKRHWPSFRRATRYVCS